MSEWIEAELAESQMHDKRHAKRWAPLLERVSEQGASSIPRAGHGWAEPRAAYRVLDHPVVGSTEILSGQQHAPRERLQAQEVVLWGQATTFLNYGTLRPQHGMRTVTEKLREE